MAPLFVPLDGRLTSQNVFTGPFDGTELFWVVAPGNANLGNTFGVTSTTLAGYFNSFPSTNREVVTAGATIGSPYLVQPGDTEVFFFKTVGAASYALCPPAASMTSGRILFKDWLGDASANPITIEFSGGQLCDGQPSVVLNNDYDWIVLTVGPTLGVGATGWGIVT